MTNKTRRHMWPVSLVVSVAIIGALAAFLVLANNPGAIMAQSDPCAGMTEAERAAFLFEGGTCGAPDTNAAPTVSSQPDTVVMTEGDPPHTIDLSTVFTDADGDPLTYTTSANPAGVVTASVSGSVLTITAVDGGAAAVTVIATDDNGASATATISVEVEVPVADRFGIAFTSSTPNQRVVSRGVFTDPVTGLVLESLVAIVRSTDDGFPHQEKVQYEVTAVDRLGNALSEDATLSVEVTPNDYAEILQSTNLDRAGLNVVGQEELEANLTIRATDDGTRSFDLTVVCDTSDGQIDIKISDKDLTVVGRARIVCESTEPPPPATTETPSDCYGVTGKMDGVVDVSGNLSRDEPVVHSYVEAEDVPMAYSAARDHYVRHNDLPDEYTWGAEAGDSIEYLTASGTLSLSQLRANPEMGQHTIQVLEGSHDVQITVTSCEEGPAYIRFLDEDGKPFGTDVDELGRTDDSAGPGVENGGDPGDPGASVTGLDSQGKLVMNLMNPLDAAAALMYDQYSVVQSADTSVAPHLAGKPGSYYQGKFRFFDPCPMVSNSFQIEVYEKDNKRLMTTETVLCAAGPAVVPTALSVTTFSDREGEALLTWTPVSGTDYHHAIVMIGRPGQITEAVPGSYIRLETTPGQQMSHLITDLSENIEYTFAVVAESADAEDPYSDIALITQEMEWE